MGRDWLTELDNLLDRERRRLRQRRLACEVSQTELARRVGISVSTLQAIEAGRARPRVDLLERLGRALEMEAEPETCER